MVSGIWAVYKKITRVTTEPIRKCLPNLIFVPSLTIMDYPASEQQGINWYIIHNRPRGQGISSLYSDGLHACIELKEFAFFNLDTFPDGKGFIHSFQPK